MVWPVFHEPKKRGHYKWREMRFVAEYCLEKFPDKLVKYRVHIGPYPEEYVKKYTGTVPITILRPALRWADAIVFDGEQAIIIEATLKARVDRIERLLYYKELFLKTPEYEHYKEEQVKTLLLLGWEWKWLIERAKARGIDIVDVYTPDWILPYLKGIPES